MRLSFQTKMMAMMSNFYIENHNHQIYFKTYNPHKLYSHSIVAGGLLVMSYTTLFTPLTSLTILLDAFSNTSYGSLVHSAVIKSVVVTNDGLDCLLFGGYDVITHELIIL